ncbi:replication initiator [Streptomyces sp. NPDC059852]|uniref:replication initiator n=1 Tax=Streptomyces sp. NPDC059852 TaxID=3346972 RepID=UPI003654BA3F
MFLKRGALHFHAVIRLDGPDGLDTPPPAWARVSLLADAIHAAASRADAAGVRPPDADEPGTHAEGY